MMFFHKGNMDNLSSNSLSALLINYFILLPDALDAQVLPRLRVPALDLHHLAIVRVGILLAPH